MFLVYVCNQRTCNAKERTQHVNNMSLPRFCIANEIMTVFLCCWVGQSNNQTHKKRDGFALLEITANTCF